MSKINVLWVEDQEKNEACKNFKVLAEMEGIKLITKGDWQTGKEYLLSHKEEISAVILDCYCKLTPEGAENDEFLKNVISEIDGISTKYGKLFPWYVLSAGSRDNFDSIIKYSLTNKRDLWDEKWTKVAYSKMNEDEDFDHLIENIKRVAEKDEDYRLRVIYHDVADILTSDRFDNDALPILLEVLKPLHFPEHRAKFDAMLHYNQIRQLVEKVFRACYNQALLPEVCIEKGKLNLWESYNYLAGQDLNHYPVRFGEKGEYVLPTVYSRIISQILFVSNKMSHATPTSQYTEMKAEDEESLRRIFATAGASNLLFGYALQLCDIIVWLNRYFDEHDSKENIAKQHNIEESDIADKLSKLKAEAQGKPYKVFKDPEGNVYCGNCYMLPKFEYLAEQGKMIIPDVVEENHNAKTKKNYPLICKKFKDPQQDKERI